MWQKPQNGSTVHSVRLPPARRAGPWPAHACHIAPKQGAASRWPTRAVAHFLGPAHSVARYRPANTTFALLGNKQLFLYEDVLTCYSGRWLLAAGARSEVLKYSICVQWRFLSRVRLFTHFRAWWHLNSWAGDFGRQWRWQTNRQCTGRTGALPPLIRWLYLGLDWIAARHNHLTACFAMGFWHININIVFVETFLIIYKIRQWNNYFF